MRKLGKDGSHQRGSVALIMVIMMIAVITTIGIEIAYRSQVSANLVINRRDHAKAYELAKAAFRWSVLRIQLDSALDSLPAIPNTNYGGKKDDLSEMQWAIPLPYPFPVQGLNISGPTPEELSLQIGGSFVSIISDESAKINVNDVGSGGPGTQKKWSGASEVLENLLLSHRFKPYIREKDHRELLWNIEDWIDIDSEVNHMAGGIEEARYQFDQRGAHIKNGPFYTVDEIRQLSIMNDALFEELKPFVTVYPFDSVLPRLSTKIVNPQGKININTAPLEIIAATFNRQALPDLKARLDCALLVAKGRETVAFRNIQDFKTFLGNQCGGVLEQAEGNQPILSNLIEPILDVRSDIFRIEAMGSSGKVEKRIEAVISRKDPKKIKTLYWRVY